MIKIKLDFNFNKLKMKNLKTEYNGEEEDDEYNQYKKRNLLLRNIQTTGANHYKIKSAVFNNFYLDYAFKEKKNLIYKAKNKVNLNNYCYELENTISLNLEILLSFMDNSKTNNNKKIVISYDNKSRDTSDTNSSVPPYMIVRLIRSIKEKFKKKAEMNKNKNELVKRINDRIYENKKYSSKLKIEKNEFRKKLHEINQTLDNKDNYLIKMNKKFFNFQKYIDDITKNKRKNLCLKKGKNNIYDIVYSNIDYKKKIKKIKQDMEKYYYEISELNTDNKLFKKELELRQDKNNSVLIRCMEFYRRTNLKIFFNIKKLKVSYKNIVKILELLNLGYIAKFSEKKQEEEGNYEIEFSKINRGDNNNDLLSKINKSINISFFAG